MHLRSDLVDAYYRATRAIIKRTPLVGKNPNIISILASLIGLISAYYFMIGRSATGGMILLLSGILDTLDGTVARLGERASKFGATLDSTLDRYVEMFVFMGIAYHFKDTPMFFWASLALMGSVMVSYVRARAQSLGVQKLVGYLQRFERFMILAIAAILNPLGMQYWGSEIILELALIILAVGTNITAFQRLMIVKAEETDAAS
ncbi:MAG: CDP-alcohol phosphatidyltransferase family protein [Candidatus Marinimicrobia bacterium]|nr:CDP-alcohol phosphatidyltransferase family protein [Candidatus Neomarinimicrobiota bacterium]MCF7850587.1 CDP-alcohol phosphatidyltransferase family protein [Candidatus Neomarinimicrobiota bacterium]MCF7903679.1 CDP-alcohol phosphatidyltransferase family protein [Candidatus Neomarinimicrobiota bacterium]